MNNRVDELTFIGGSIAILYGESLLTLIYYKNCSFINNYSSKKAGVFAILFGDVFESDSNHVNNQASLGSSVFIFGSCRYFIDNSTFFNGTSSYNGVLRITEAAIVNIINSRFFNNNATMGTCLSVEGFQISLKVLSILTNLKIIDK